MANATVNSRSTGANNSPLDTHTITNPSALSSQGVLVCFTNDVARAVVETTSSGWELLAQQAPGTSTNHKGSVFWAQDASAASDLVVDISGQDGAEEATWAVFVIDNPGVPVVAGDKGSGASFSMPTASITADDDVLCIAYVGVDSSTGTNRAVSSWPAGFSNELVELPTTTSSASTCTAEQVYTSDGEISPGSVSLNATEQHVQFTILFPGQEVSSPGGGGNNPTQPPSLVRQANLSTGGTNSKVQTGSWTGGATAGNLLVVCGSGDKNTGTATIVDNVGGTWIPILDIHNTGWAVSSYMWYKVAQGGETSFTLTTELNAAVGAVSKVLEIEQDGTTDWKIVAQSIPAYYLGPTGNNTNNSVNTKSSGTTGPAEFAGIGVAMNTIDSVNTVTRSWSNSFVDVGDPATIGSSGGGNSAAWVATKQIAKDATAETTVTISGGGDEMYGALIVFGREVVTAVVNTTRFFLSY